ncbi:MAG: class I SAM-dependent methyltransferase [Candidatus Methanomethylicaceae archaeon]
MPKDQSSPSHYFTKLIGGKKRKYSIHLNFAGHSLSLTSSSGVFSKERVDLGTMVLLESLSLPEEGEILDMGCGYGVIGIGVAKSRPKVRVTLVDVNPIAIRLARENIEKNQITNATVIRSDLYSQLKGKNLILSSPTTLWLPVTRLYSL